MRAVWIVLFVASCGGKVVGQGAGDAGNDTGDDPLGGGGKMLSGPCTFGSEFEPKGDKWYAGAVDTKGISTATAGKPFTFQCSGKAADGYYYATTLEPVMPATGAQTAMGDMYQSANGREAERAYGPCTITILSDTTTNGRRTLGGSFDCPYLYDDPIGHFHLHGTFDVPLP